MQINSWDTLLLAGFNKPVGMELPTSFVESIKCWTHACDGSTIIISQKSVTYCHFCKMKTSNEPLRLLTEIACPFIESNETKCDIVLIPSKGTFKDVEFNNNTGLHIGVTQRDGHVLEFDQNGIQYGCENKEKWRQCIALKFLDYIALDRYDRILLELLWDRIVQQFVTTEKSFNSQYHSIDNNCFDFVLYFLNTFFASLSRRQQARQQVIDTLAKISDKVTFCQQFVVQKTKQAALYLILHRKLGSLDRLVHE